MTPALSLFLDLTRLLAAGAVFLSHASWHAHTGGLMWQLSRLGGEAVDVFFVLSGFVIAHVSATRESTAREYAISRLARIGSVAVPALVLTFVLDAAGKVGAPELYRGFCCETAGPVVWQYLRNLVFLGDVWSLHVSPGSNIPWWSLGFEAWYYLAFGVLLFARPGWRLVGALAVMAVAGPGIAVLFPLWLAGAVARRMCEGRRLDPGVSGVAMGVGAGGLVLVSVLVHRHGDIYDPFALTAVRLADYGQDYLVGGLFLLVLLGAHGLSERLAGVLGRIAGPVRWLAGASFALYLFHLPLIRATVALSPWPAEAWPTRVAVLVGVPIVVLALAEVTERRKSAWRGALQRLYPARD